MQDEIKARLIVALVKFVVIMGLLAGAGYYIYHAIRTPPKPTTKEVIEVIRSEELSFLVTDRLVTKAVVMSTASRLVPLLA